MRSQDPFFHIAGGWVARRLAPDCVKLDLPAVPNRDLERRLLGWMGAETANIHLAGPHEGVAVQSDLAGRRRDWLSDAASRLARATREDHGAWRKRSEGSHTQRD